jgi:uncharacterized protein (TIGR02268 family)
MCFRALILLILLALAGAARAQQAPSSVGAGRRRIEVRADVTEIPTVFIRPGLSTTLLFSSPLTRDGVELERRESFRWAEIGKHSISLVPGEGLAPGARLRLRVRFAEGPAPSSAVFHLEVSPTLAERQVEIDRLPLSCESCAQPLREAREETLRYRETFHADRTKSCEPESLTGLLRSGVMDTRGVLSRDLGVGIKLNMGISARVVGGVTYRSAQRVALRLEVHLSEADAPWKMESVALEPGLHLREVWPLTPLPPGLSVILIEADAEWKEAQGEYALELREAGGDRSIVLEGVQFP